MGSNVAFALRSILRKDLPKDFKVRMDGENERDKERGREITFIQSL